MSPVLRTLVEWEVALLLGGMAAIVALKLLVGEINGHGLLLQKQGDRSTVGLERAQLLVFTIGTALYYLSTAAQNYRGGAMPSIPQAWTGVIGGSNAWYLLGKAYQTFRKKAGS